MLCRTASLWSWLSSSQAPLSQRTVLGSHYLLTYSSQEFHKNYQSIFALGTATAIQAGIVYFAYAARDDMNISKIWSALNSTTPPLPDVSALGALAVSFAFFNS